MANHSVNLASTVCSDSNSLPNLQSRAKSTMESTDTILHKVKYKIKLLCWSMNKTTQHCKLNKNSQQSNKTTQWKSFSALQTILLTTILRANKLKIMVLLRIVSYRNDLSEICSYCSEIFYSCTRSTRPYRGGRSS